MMVLAPEDNGFNLDQTPGDIEEEIGEEYDESQSPGRNSSGLSQPANLDVLGDHQVGAGVISPTGEHDLSQGELSQQLLGRSLTQEEARDVGAHLIFRKGNKIGAGAYGTVWMGLVPATGKLLAIKQLEFIEGHKEDQERVESIQMETAILSVLRHPNICGYIGSKTTQEKAGQMALNILLEWIPGGSIASLIDTFGPLEEETVRVYTHQILEGLHYLHTNRVTHRDIKGANILVTCDGCIKLTDFGHSKMDYSTLNVETMKMKSLKGTPFWMAPEVVREEGYGRRADIWSLGCTIIEMSSGVPPWADAGTNQFTVMMKIANGKEPPKIPDHLSEAGQQFLLQCFQRDPQQRPNAAQLLTDPWLEGVSSPSSEEAALATANSARGKKQKKHWPDNSTAR